VGDVQDQKVGTEVDRKKLLLERGWNSIRGASNRSRAIEHSIKRLGELGYNPLVAIHGGAHTGDSLVFAKSFSPMTHRKVPTRAPRPPW
jgi:hypothetical protein